MSPIKGGCRQETVFRTVQLLMKDGMTVREAIKRVEGILHGQLPEQVKALIYQECK